MEVVAEEKPEEKPETAEQAPAEEKKEETAEAPAAPEVANHEEDAPKVEVVSEGEVKGEEKPEEEDFDFDAEPAKEKVDPWKMVGNATLTPCGPGVITQLTEDGRAAVLFVASCVLPFRSYA